MISYCGLFCPDCFIRENRIADLAVELKKNMDRVRFSSYAKGLSGMVREMSALKHYPLFYKALQCLDGLRCTGSCRTGTGTSGCRIRQCCRKKGLNGCWECPEFEKCKKLAWLKPVNGEANLKNLRKLKKASLRAFITGKKYWHG